MWIARAPAIQHAFQRAFRGGEITLRAAGTAAEAVAEVFGDLDEQTLVAKAVQKKLRGRTKLQDRNERARLYQFLMRQGFSPAAVAEALRKLGARDDET